MNQLIIKIMNFAQRLVDADRASLFLVDAKTNQLYARIFDVKGNDKDSTENGGKDIAKEIRYDKRFYVPHFFMLSDYSTIILAAIMT